MDGFINQFSSRVNGIWFVYLQRKNQIFKMNMEKNSREIFYRHNQILAKPKEVLLH